ncbi:hypothetical protein [Pseudoalteromonas sp. DY56-GL79]|uniref:hypothetical protein n=1 Tax=Pseudoalteromonas sp. DY56-GL79 TaxID=2967131 RepID=UPI00352ACFD8
MKSLDEIIDERVAQIESVLDQCFKNNKTLSSAERDFIQNDIACLEDICFKKASELRANLSGIEVVDSTFVNIMGTPPSHEKPSN